MDFHPEQSKKRVEVIVDITPLIDVVFLLLIFFMITTTFVNSPGIEVDLPKSSTSENPVQPQDVVVAISPDGDIIYEHSKVSIIELAALLESKFKEKPDATVVVQADREVYHGLVVQVMDAAKQAGYSKLAIATQEQ